VKDKSNKTGCPFLQGKTTIARKIAKKMGCPIREFKLSDMDIPPSGSPNNDPSGEK